MYFATAFVLFCAACTVLAFVRHPIWGLYFYLAVTYVFPPARWWGTLLGSDIRWSLIAAIVSGAVSAAQIPLIAAIAGLAATAAGAYTKYAIVTRAGFNQGFALAHLPVRGVRP